MAVNDSVKDRVGRKNDAANNSAAMMLSWFFLLYNNDGTEGERRKSMMMASSRSVDYVLQIVAGYCVRRLTSADASERILSYEGNVILYTRSSSFYF
jgi:hypothetical protein